MLRMGKRLRRERSMRLNILMIMTDQQHKYALGSVLPYVHTPNLDRLAAGGTRFTNAYSNNPVDVYKRQVSGLSE